MQLTRCSFSSFLQVYQSGSGHPSWKPIFVAVSDRDLLLYDSAPSSKEAWATPMQTHPLIATRLVHSGPGPGQPGKSQQVLTFGTRTGRWIRPTFSNRSLLIKADSSIGLWLLDVVPMFKGAFRERLASRALPCIASDGVTSCYDCIFVAVSIMQPHASVTVYMLQCYLLCLTDSSLVVVVSRLSAFPLSGICCYSEATERCKCLRFSANSLPLSLSAIIFLVKRSSLRCTCSVPTRYIVLFKPR